MTSKLGTAGLVERLRAKRMRVHDLSGVGWEDDPDCIAAADLIEALTAQLSAAQGERDALETLCDHKFDKIAALGARAEAAEARVAELEAAFMVLSFVWTR